MDWSDAGLIVVVTAVVQALKLIKWVADRTGFLPVVALAFGLLVAAARAVALGPEPIEWYSVIKSGLLIGAGSIAAYNVAVRPAVAKVVENMLASVAGAKKK
jgi:hypothetical protein